MPKNTNENELKQLNEKLDNILSFKMVFVRGLIRGVGVAIGASIIAAIILSILGSAVKTVDDIPVLREIIRAVPTDRIDQ